MTWIESKRVVVTGATSGIGREGATRLAGLGANVVLAVRDPRRGGEVAAAIDATTEPGRATVMTVDMSDQRSIRSFARAYHHTYASFDVLVNNAGVLLPERATSADGIELTFATNVLGYHLLTAELLATQPAAAPTHVVNVASTFAFGVDLDDLQFDRRPYDGMTAYAQSKACNRMLTWALARRHQRGTVTVNAMAPGLVLDTSLYRRLSAEAIADLAQYGTRSLSEGAETAVWMASSPELHGVTGRFFEQGAEIPCELRDEVAEERLWHTCEELIRQLELRV